jgi:hypothetical protein
MAPRVGVGVADEHDAAALTSATANKNLELVIMRAP